MKRLAVILLSTALLAAALAPQAHAAFGLEEVDLLLREADGSPATQAGSHPYEVVGTVAFNTKPDPNFEFEIPDEAVKDLFSEQIPGIVGKPAGLPVCATVDFLGSTPECPAQTQLGTSDVEIASPGGFIRAPVYNLQPPPGTPVRLGLVVAGVPVTMELGIEAQAPNNVVFRLTNVSQGALFYGAILTLWGMPADPRHDPDRIAPGCIPGKGCSVNLAEEPFLTLPRACEGPLETNFAIDSWQDPGDFDRASILTHDDTVPPNPQGMTGCGRLAFEPQMDAKATTDSAETATGLDFSLSFEDEGLTNPEGIAQSDLKETVVTLPQGMTVNPSVGEGLGVCDPGDLDRETLSSAPGEGCPNNSKIGAVVVRSSLIDEPIEGSVFLAPQDDPKTSTLGAENPFDSLLAFYIVLKNSQLGVLVKLPAKVEPDPTTGQLRTTVSDIPQVPFSDFDFHFREGQRGVLVSPPACGRYETHAELTPWARPSETLHLSSSFQITEGVGGRPCPPGGVPPFGPDFEAGSLNNNAGSFTPFNMRLLRKDGDQDMTKFSSILPPGVLGSLTGVSKCPDPAIAAAKGKTGREELAAPSCPANSQIGRTLAGAGVGGALTYVGGQIYLGGPYKGAPLSVISVTPAVAGPFDAGTVVVRLGLTLNPKTAEVEVDGAASDPIPHILKGIVLKVRDIRVYVDRDNFILNPTSCDPSNAKATLFGSFLDVFSPTDDVPVDMATRFQAANCLNLGFKPKLNFKLTGGTKRGDHPELRAVYRPRPGDANLEGLVVRLPRSAFLDQAHIRTICTRVQFAAKSCPQGAQYGFIRAWTPLLETPLEGPAYLRSSDHNLPDLVFDLKGLVDVEVSTRIDSANGGIRATLDSAPDAPISLVVLRMQGGKKGLIVNSRDLCIKKSRANLSLSAHNGRHLRANPVMRASCKAKGSRVRARS